MLVGKSPPKRGNRGSPVTAGGAMGPGTTSTLASSCVNYFNAHRSGCFFLPSLCRARFTAFLCRVRAKLWSRRGRYSQPARMS